MIRVARIPPAGLLLLLALAFYLPGVLSPRDFTVADEARYAEVLREMMHGGHWIVPYLNGAYYADKPPLYFWLAAGVSHLLGGITPLSFLLVTWIGAAGSIWVTYRLGLAIFSRRAAFIGALLLMSTFVFVACAQFVRMDMMMCFFIALAFLFFHRGLAREQPAQYYGFYIASALAVLSKGPLGFLIPFLSALGFLVQRKRWRALRQWVFHWGLALFVVLVGGWLVAAWRLGEQEFVKDIFGRQIVGRALRSSVQRQPFYFYALVLPFVLLPWSPFLIRAARNALRTAGEGVGLLLAWFVAGFVVISAISGKLFIYLLPMMPPLLLIVGSFVDDLWERRTSGSGCLRAEGMAAVVLTFGIISLVPLAASKIPMAASLPLWPLAALFLPVTILGVVLSWSGRPKALVVTLVAGMWLFSAYAFQVLVPRVNDLCSARSIGKDIAGRLENGGSVASLHVQRGILDFYAEAVIPDVSDAELATYLEAPRHFVVLSEKEFRRRPWLGQRFSTLAGYYIVDRRYLIVGGTGRLSE